MKKFFKWLGIIVLSLIVIVVVVALVLANKYNKMADTTYEANVPDIAIPSDSASLARGAVIAASICSSCHGGDFAGTAFFDVPKIATIPAPNITSGGRTKNYTDKDWVRTLRYGVKPDNHGVFIMPSKTIGMMSDKDLGSLIAYMKTIPVSDKTWPDPHFTFMRKVMAGAGMFGTLYEADEIDLTDNKPKMGPEPGPTVEYGAYTVGFHGCKSCHGETLNGHKTPDPVSPPGENITPGGNIGKWSLDQFKETLRTGNTPEGEKIDPEFMPWQSLGLMTDMELEAIYNYLKTVPAMSDSKEVVKWEEDHKE